MASEPSRTIWIGSRRTSLRLEATMRDALADIAARQGKTVHDLIAKINREHRQTSLSSGIRVYRVLPGRS